MLNADQKDYVESLSRMPPEAKSPCGWYPRGECDRNIGCPGCAGNRAKAGLPEHDLALLLRQCARRRFGREYPSRPIGDEGYKAYPEWKAADLIDGDAHPFAVHRDARKGHELSDTIGLALTDWQKKATGYKWLAGRTAHDISLIAEHVAAALSAKP